MADTQIDATVDTDAHSSKGLWGPFWLDESIGMIVYHDDDNLEVQKTTDKGANWTNTVVDTAAMVQLACWFDQETPGDSGTLIHMVWMEIDTDDINYRTIDISDASLGTERQIASVTEIHATDIRNRCSITKSRSGNLYASYFGETGTEEDFLRSTDSGENWTSRAALHEGVGGERDHVLLFPANTGDDDDICALYWDGSVDDLSIQMYDNSANSWTETDCSCPSCNSSRLCGLTLCRSLISAYCLAPPPRMMIPFLRSSISSAPLGRFSVSLLGRLIFIGDKILMTARH